jgi:Flp pilus assembly protein TadG
MAGKSQCVSQERQRAFLKETKMNFFQRLKSSVARLARNESGQFGIIFALGGSMLVLCVGLSVDFARMLSAKSHLATALDAAVTSTARDITRGKIDVKDAEKIIRAFLDANLDGQPLGVDDVVLTKVFIDPATTEISASARADVDIMFPIMGRPKVEQVNVSMGALYSERIVEVSMVLDVTGSMADNNKIGDLKVAAKSAVKSFLESGSDNTRVAITPYSWGVNAGTLKSSVKDLKGNEPADGCSTERRGEHMFSDVSPTAATVTRANDFKFFDAGNGNTYTVTNGNWSCPAVPVQPLTKDAKTLNSMIDKLQAKGATAGQIGIQWGWYMLSPNWKSELPTKSEPAAYGVANTEKYMIVMTDGMFNSEASGLSNAAIPSHPGVTLASGRLALSYCDKIKDRNIKVYTIGFDLKNAGNATQQTEVKRMLKDCATTPIGTEKTFYEAQNGAELKKAFDEIAARIQTLRLTN